LGAGTELGYVVNSGSLSTSAQAGAGRVAMRVAAWYALLASAWILASGHAVRLITPARGGSELVEAALGLLFVAVTTIALFLFVRGNMRRSERQEIELRAVLSSMSDAVLLVLPGRDQVIGANQAAARLFGLPAGDELKMPLQTVTGLLRPLGSAGGGLPGSLLLRALEGETIVASEAAVLQGDGRTVPVSISAVPLRSKSGTSAAVAVLRDISQVRHLEQLREDFLSTAAHELKTPIATIKGYAQLLQMWDASSRPLREQAALEAVTRQCGRMARLIQELLDMSRLKLDKLPLRRQRVDLAQVARDVATRVSVFAGGHAIAVTGSPGQWVEADPDRLDAVVTNLVDNAVRFSPEEAEVRVEVDSQGDQCVVSIYDRGLGIPADTRDHVFEPFYQGHSGANQHRSGIGIGLYLSREVVERHGGHMWFESEEGRGSTFHFSLPRALTRPLPAEQGSHESARGG
jgi:two-component system, OmpR family, phosphate regulon sensor histidine kinase PhoR